MFKMCCGECNECWYVGNERTCTCPKESTWADLTDEEIKSLGLESYMEVFKIAMAKLKEKNERL